MSLVTSHRFQFTSKDGLQIACTRWNNRAPSRGIIQIAHGMGEHIGRYQNFAKEFAHAGMVVFGNDHRGHGRTARSPKDFGDLGPGGFNWLVEDMVQLSDIVKRENPKQPLILLGHGMGSFAAQQYILDHSDLIDGLVLSGSGVLDELARLTRAAQPAENILNTRFQPARTPFDWLSGDPAVVDAFMKDPLCFAALQPASQASFLAAASKLADTQSLRGIRSDLPIYLFSGSEDPVGQQLEGVQLLMDRYRKAGISNLSHHFYPGGRHEMLNEINRCEVMTNLVLWISAILHW
ncbi:MAG TPA: alpha/beta hydrolase [Candidatus Acidoferrales bacterium]|nr:alpha/beta hydrolase [Candidatus Acidoferrales bacterium]